MKQVICDTNVWYEIGSGKFKPNPTVELYPTIFSLYEIATTPLSVRHPKVIQEAIKAVFEHATEIIPVNPFDFVLSQQSSRFLNWDTTMAKDMLKTFQDMLRIDFDLVKEIPPDLATKVTEESRIARAGAEEFVNYVNTELPNIRKEINKSYGAKEHRQRSRTESVKKMTFGFLNDYLQTRGDSLQFDHIDWSEIELFISVTESYFTKLEITKGMKADINDAYDWLNLLYVQPGQYYMTFDQKWQDFIKLDPRISHYLYLPE